MKRDINKFADRHGLSKSEIGSMLKRNQSEIDRLANGDNGLSELEWSYLELWENANA